MSDPFFDDVKELLDKEKGDERILKQIYRACENNEVISNYERNYVRKLAEKYLGRKPLVEEKPSAKEPSIPDVVISEPPLQKTQTFQKESPRIKKSDSKNTKMMLGIGGAALTAIIIIAVASMGISNIEDAGITNPTVTKPTVISSSLAWASSLNHWYRRRQVVEFQQVVDRRSDAHNRRPAGFQTYAPAVEPAYCSSPSLCNRQVLQPEPPATVLE